MNSNLNRALSSALLAFGTVAPALAQFDWDKHCIDPNNTAPYSTDYLVYRLSNDLFGAGIGISGTVAYGPAANLCGAVTAPVVGRIGFTIGNRGSIQDNDPNQDFGGVLDDNMRLTLSTNNADDFRVEPTYPGVGFSPAVGGMSFARVYVRNLTTGATTNFLYGQNGIRLAFVGRSGRYMYTDALVDGTDFNNSVYTRCIIDVLGDAARVSWRLTNRLNFGTATAVPVGLGLWFGSTVALVTADHQFQLVPFGGNGRGFTYTTIPGRKPLTVNERFNATGLDTDGVTQGGATVGVPAYCNFSASQVAGFGLQVVNSPTALSAFDAASTADQTPVDEFVYGNPGIFSTPGVIDGRFGTTDPQFPDFLFNAPGNGNADAAANAPFPSFLQKWQPVPVQPAGSTGSNGSRDIVAYYRSTNGDSSYSTGFDGYTAVVDTPKSISTVTGDPNDFTPNPFTIRVNVDNTGGFSTVDQFVTMQSVTVTLNLPNGMHDPNNPLQRTITRTISNVAPATLGFVDFQVQVDDTTFGALPYHVDITPQPGFFTKTINGVINVATTPRLLIRSGANLVGPPWQFADNSWETILGLDLNGDFQSYTWDATVQQYVPQTAAERGRGTWIVSNSDLNSRVLGGTPRQPNDQFPDPSNNDVGGAPIVQLHPGWNLVANPYNYAFDIGQIVGVPDGTATALPYSDLVSQGYTDGAFTAYDQSNKSYVTPISGAGSRLQPNSGYWLFANFGFTLQFPPIYDTFVRSAEPAAFVQRFDNWRLQLSAASAGAADMSTYVGVARKATDARSLSYLKAPISPAANAIRAYAVGAPQGNAQYLTTGRGAKTFTYRVLSKKAGPVTVSWPNLKQIPSNLAVTVKDMATGKSVNARTTTGYSYNAVATSERSFTVSVTPKATVAQRVGSVSTSIIKGGPVKRMKISYVLGGRGSATLRVYKGATLVGLAADDVDAVAGTNSVQWPMLGLNALPLDDGTYTLAVSATGEGGDVATRQITINVRH